MCLFGEPREDNLLLNDIVENGMTSCEQARNDCLHFPVTDCLTEIVSLYSLHRSMFGYRTS
jgi:hypothetical protein